MLATRLVDHVANIISGIIPISMYFVIENNQRPAFTQILSQIKT